MGLLELEKKIDLFEKSLNRLNELEDLEKIKKLHRRYISRIDTLDFEGIEELFSDDAKVEIRNSHFRHGKEEIADLYMNVFGKNISKKDAHFVGQGIVDVTGDTAIGSWKVLILFIKPSKEWVQGVNECEYVKIDGEWKFQTLKFTRILASDESLYP